MLRLSDFCNSKEIWSVRCGSTGCNAINKWSFGGPSEAYSIKVRDIY